MTPLQKILQTQPKAVFFDLDNTLYEYSSANIAGMAAIYTKLLSAYPLDKTTLENAFAQARTEIKQQTKSTASSHSRLLYFQRMLEILGMNTQALLSLDLEQTYWRAYLRKAQLFDGVKNFLYELRARNIQTLIVSDLTAQIQLRKLIHFDIDGLIDYVVTSEEAGADKPHQNIFNLALKKANCDPQDVWMIGDSLEKDMEGAEALSITTIQKIDKENIGLVRAHFTHFHQLSCMG